MKKQRQKVENVGKNKVIINKNINNNKRKRKGNED